MEKYIRGAFIIFGLIIIPIYEREIISVFPRMPRSARSAERKYFQSESRVARDELHYRYCDFNSLVTTETVQSLSPSITRVNASYTARTAREHMQRHVSVTRDSV